MRKFHVKAVSDPKIKLEEDSRSISYGILGNGFKMNQIIQVGLPPKGSNHLIPRELTIAVVRFLDKLDPGDVSFVEEFVKVFKQQGSVLNINVEHPQTPLRFWPAHSSPSYHCRSLILHIRAPP